MAASAMVTNAWRQDKAGKWYYLGSDGAMVTGRLMQIGDEVFAFGAMEPCAKERSGADAMSEGRWRLYKGCIKKRLQLLFHKKKTAEKSARTSYHLRISKLCPKNVPESLEKP